MTDIPPKYTKILDQLKTIASDIPPVGSARIAAAIYYKKDVVGYGVCQYRSHPFQRKFGKVPEAIYLHAEIDALRNAISRKKDIEFLKNSVLLVARVRKINGVFEEARACPCAGCQKAIAAFNIKQVIYTEGPTLEVS